MPSIFGQRIKDRLKQVRQTQRWLAGQVNIPEQTISNLVNSRHDESGNITQAVPIAKALNTTVDYLFGVTSNPERPIWPSRKVRRIAMLAEMLPEPELDRLLADVAKRAEMTKSDNWKAEVMQVMEDLIQRHGGDVEAALKTLDQLVNSATPDSKPSGGSADTPAPSLFDEWRR